MNGSDLVAMLLEELNCPNKAQLAHKLGVEPAQIQAWGNSELSKTIVRNVLRRVRDSAVSGSIVPITEFHKLNHIHGHNTDTLRKKIDHKGICDKLAGATGIYSFYDSNGRVIYVGKTEKSNLLNEMSQAFNLKRPNYLRKLADKKGRFSIQKLAIRDTAEFISAYDVDQNVIGNVEAFLTRMIPNDVVNKKTENFR